jgi:hypothetical protein
MTDLPYPAITKIPAVPPQGAVSELWNPTYLEADANFDALNTRTNDLEDVTHAHGDAEVPFSVVADETELGVGTIDGEWKVCKASGNRYQWSTADAKWTVIQGNWYAALPSDTTYLLKENTIITHVVDGDLVLKQWNGSEFAPFIRNILTGSMSRYCSTSGDDNDGDGTSVNPWYSPHKAIEYMQEFIFKGPNMGNIYLAPGNYDFSALGPCYPDHISGRQIKIMGSGSIPANTELEFDSNGIVFNSDAAGILIDNLTLKGPGSGFSYAGLVANHGSFVTVTDSINIEGFSNGATITHRSNLFIPNTMTMTDCLRGMRVSGGGYVNAYQQLTITGGQYGILGDEGASVILNQGANVQNAELSGMYFYRCPFVFCRNSAIGHDGVGGDGGYGIRSYYGTFIDALDSVVDDTNITMAYQPTINTIGNEQSYIHV